MELYLQRILLKLIHPQQSLLLSFMRKTTKPSGFDFYASFRSDLNTLESKVLLNQGEVCQSLGHIA